MSDSARCRACNRSCDARQAPMLAWVCDRRPGAEPAWLCPDCARDNLRSIEAKLPDEWW